MCHFDAYGVAKLVFVVVPASYQTVVALVELIVVAVEVVHANEALADILTGKLAEASSAIKGDDARSEYLSAIIAARKGDAEGVREHLAGVEAKSKALYEKARKDVEFAKFR